MFYRPLSTELYYASFVSLFGLALAPLAMHTAMLLVHSTNAYLVSLLARKVKGVSDLTSAYIGLLYGIWGIHFMSLFYIGATQQLLAMLFTLLAALSLLKNKYSLHLLMIILALLSKELSIRIPLFLFFYLLLTGNSAKAALKKSLPGAAVVLLYLGFRLAYGVTTPSEYALVLSPLTTLATTMWYFLMSLGMPEHILRFGLSGGLVDFAGFAESTGVMGYLNLISYIGILVLFLVSAVRMAKTSVIKLISLLGIWFSSILPVIFLPTHRFAHYLDLSILAILILVATSLGKKMRYLFLGLGLVVSLSSIYLDYSTHWAVTRAGISSHIQDRIKTDQACNYPVWHITGSEHVQKEVGYATLWENFLPIICSSPIELVYNEPLEDGYYLLELTESDLLRR